MNERQSLVSIYEGHVPPFNPPKPSKHFKRLRQWWAMIQLRRMLARDGVHVWKYSDDEIKAQCVEGLRQCLEMAEIDALKRLAKL
jgi:hypothetical protein